MSEPDPAFISETIIPDRGTADTRTMARGDPGLPAGFTWRGKSYTIRKELRSWKETGPCRHGSGEAYVRKHWFEVELESGQNARIYFERQARGRKKLQRWWLYNLTPDT